MQINLPNPGVRFLPHVAKVLHLHHGGPHFLPCTPWFRKVRQYEFDPKSCRFLPPFGTPKTLTRKTRDRGIQPADVGSAGPPNGRWTILETLAQAGFPNESISHCVSSYLRSRPTTISCSSGLVQFSIAMPRCLNFRILQPHGYMCASCAGPPQNIRRSRRAGD